MKLHRFSVALAMLVIFASVGPVFATASASTVVERIPTNFQVFVPCANNGAGELVVLSGQEVIVTSWTDSGKTVRQSVLVNFAGVSGVGVESGTTYQGTGNSRSSATVGNGETVTFVSSFRMVGAGPANDLVIFQVVHQTWNASGELTSDVNLLSFSCV